MTQSLSFLICKVGGQVRTEFPAMIMKDRMGQMCNLRKNIYYYNVILYFEKNIVLQYKVKKTVVEESKGKVIF
jgi:hypothetical protein